MLTKAEIASWVQTEKIREQLVARYAKPVQSAIKSAVAPIIRNIERAITLDELDHVIDATTQSPIALVNIITDIYVRSGSIFGLHVLETLKGFDSIQVTKADISSAIEFEVQTIEPSFFERQMRLFAARVGADKVVSITNTNRIILKQIVAAAVENGWSMYRTARHMAAFFHGELSAARAIMIARTEVMTASSYAGNLTAEEIQKRFGVQLKKQWLPTPTGDFRPTHLAMAGHTPILLDQPYIVGGISMQHPHDPNAPASEVINCRCSQRFVPI